MFGFVFGTLCLIGLFALLRRRHHYRFAHYACGPGHGFGYVAPSGDSPWVRRSRRRRGDWIRDMFEQLDTTPGQEKAILKSIEALRQQMTNGRSELDAVRKQVAQALGGDELDETILSAALERVEDLIAQTKLELMRALTEVHASLDGNQRKELAEMIADGFVPRRYNYERMF